MQFLGQGQTIYIELLGHVNLYLGVGLQVLSALLLGGLVGYDREKKMKAAGLKTNILICVGACLYTTMSSVRMAAGDGVHADPNRVAAQIVSGIGFLGAGAIIQGKNTVIGLTTAATIWVVAAIGYTVGIGYPFSASVFSLTVLSILKAVNPIYRRLEKEKQEQTFQIDVLSVGPVKKMVKDIIFSETLDILEFYEEVVNEKKNIRVTTAIFSTYPRTVERICNEIREGVIVERVSYHVYQEDSISQGYEEEGGHK